VPSPGESTRSLPLERAFVVQLHADADVAHGQLMGRVEHVRSARATHFHSLEELLTFFRRVLAAPPADASEGT
jgi:hypothetical protein